MSTRQKRTMVLILAMVLLAMFVLACSDWDMDRSGWEARYHRSKQPCLPTPQSTPPNIQPGDDKLWLAIWGNALEAAQ